jgi:hypothetical protein
MAAARQGLPVRLDRAPQRGAAFALTRASRRARKRSIGSCSRTRASSLIFDHPPAVAPPGAYVTGGFGKHDPPNRLFVSIHNNGKTPAIVDYLFIDVCPLGNLPPISEILTKRKYVNYSVPPLTRIVGIDFFATWDGAPDHIFFGRFWYTDIFGDTHESGFALHLGKPDGMPAADAPEYWKWT